MTRSGPARHALGGLGVGLLFVAAGLMLLGLAVEADDGLLTCESRRHDSTYGDPSLALDPPAIRCDFRDDIFFPELDVEYRYRTVLTGGTMATLVATTAAGWLLGRRRARTADALVARHEQPSP